ncbi:helix-turn-helix domain-containing protein [Tenacibaculum sp. nBUS_03]|uniref:helix-turn-helix domain-containing protein n=1 Tax=Tenacibaculum sp. nBUS_03 TaxID=3395320 RepID=UPI003EBEB0E9
MAIIEALLFSMLFILVWLFPSLIEKLFIYGFMDVYMISSSIFVGYFCIRIIKINLTHKNKLLQFYEDVKYKTLLWLSAFCVICIVLNFLGFLGRFLFLNSENYHVLTEVLFLISLYYITIASLVQINISNVINTSKVSLNEIQQELVEVCKTIDYYMANEKLYLNPSLNLSFLSNYIKIPDRLISKSINEIKNKNFNRFVHEYRIEEFKRLILDKKYDKYSIEALAHEIGYNSRASFYKNFKTIVGVSPHDYIENVKINKE